MLARVGYLEMVVADLDASVTHATDVLGLRTSEQGPERAHLTCSPRHHELVLRRGPASALGRIGLEVADEASLDQICSNLDRAGTRWSENEGTAVERSVLVVAPGGIEFDLFLGMSEGEPYPYDTVAVRPRKFGHATLKSSAPDELGSFLVDLLGFRLSDELPGVLAWYRCDADHHGVAIAPADEDGLHHYAFELEGWSQIEAFADHLGSRQIELIWGPGRHGPGRNLFTYHFDPIGAVVEVFADLQRIESEWGYELNDWSDVPRALNQWGPGPPEDFLDHIVPAEQAVPAAAGRES